MYDSRNAADKFSFDQTMKKAMPFKRRKIDSATFNKPIESKNLKEPIEVLKGHDLRRQINKQDGGMILQTVLGQMYAEQRKQWAEYERQQRIESL
jgi:uncharacterized protein (DUF2225 family)